MIKVEILPPEKWWLFAKYRIVDDLVIANIRVPAGFITDGTTLSRWWTAIGLFIVMCAHLYTVPWLFAIGIMAIVLPTLFPRVDYAFSAVVLHDYLLTREARDYADEKFREALVDLHVPKWRIIILFYAVTTYSKIMHALNANFK